MMPENENACVMIKGLTEPSEKFYWPAYLLPQKEKRDDDESGEEEEVEEEEVEEEPEGPLHTVSSHSSVSYIYIIYTGIYSLT